MLTLHCTRSKIFLRHGTSEQFMIGRGEKSMKVPDWVADTPDYANGVADHSIIDLTPIPQPVRSKRPAAPVVDEAVKDEDGLAAASDGQDEGSGTLDASETTDGAAEVSGDQESTAAGRRTRLPKGVISAGGVVKR